MNADPWPDPFAGEPDWAPQPPKPIIPTPAGEHVTLRGRRVIVGIPGVGWRADLRADEKVVQASRTYIPVVPEQEWYRAESEQLEVFAPLVPVERVWVELPSAAPAAARATRPDVLSRLVSLDAPPRRDPVAVVNAGTVTGRRVVEVADGAERRDLRAVTEVHTNSEGDICVRVATELDWYRWAWNGHPPTTVEVPVHLLWVE